MRLSNRNDLQLQQLADGYRNIGGSMDPAIFEELIDRRAAMSPMRMLECSFAYERASAVIEDACLVEAGGEADLNGWYKLDTFGDFTADMDKEAVGQAVEYLESRHLLLHHPEHNHWVAIRDEAEG